jgi:hypothetical protein
MDKFQLVDGDEGLHDRQYQCPTYEKSKMDNGDDEKKSDDRTEILKKLQTRNTINASCRAFWAADTLQDPRWKDDAEVRDAALTCVEWCLGKMPPKDMTDTTVSRLFNEQRPLLQDSKNVIKALARRISSLRKNVVNHDASLCDSLKYASPRLKGDPDLILDLMTWLNASSDTFVHAQASIRQNKELILKLVRKRDEFSFLKHVSLSQDLCRIIVKNNGLALKELPDVYQDDANIVLAAVQSNGRALEYASRAKKDDETIVMAAVQNCGLALEHASRRFQNSEEVVMNAVDQEGLAFKYASPFLMNNFNFVVRAAKMSKWVLGFVPDAIKRNKEAMMKVISVNPSALSQISDKLQDDPDIVIRAVALDGRVFQFASDRLKDDDLTVLRVTVANGESLFYANDRFRSNKVILMEAVKTHPHALIIAHQSLLCDEELILQALKHTNEENVRAFWKFPMFLPMKTKINNFAVRLFKNHGDDCLMLKRFATNTDPEDDSPSKRRKVNPNVFCVKQWKHRYWERIWTVSQIGSLSGCIDGHKRQGMFSVEICRSIIKYANLHSVFSHEKQLKDLEPLVNKMFSLGLTYKEPHLPPFQCQEIPTDGSNLEHLLSSYQNAN